MVSSQGLEAGMENPVWKLSWEEGQKTRSMGIPVKGREINFEELEQGQCMISETKTKQGFGDKDQE